MSYQSAMEAAGAQVHDFEQFGSYQGEWWAFVTYKGVTGWVNGSYGSCSGCDAFEAEFGYGHEDDEDYIPRLIAFGEGYLDYILTQEEAIKEASRNLEWDTDAEAMVAFIKSKGSQ